MIKGTASPDQYLELLTVTPHLGTNVAEKWFRLNWHVLHSQKACFMRSCIISNYWYIIISVIQCNELVKTVGWVFVY